MPTRSHRPVRMGIAALAAGCVALLGAACGGDDTLSGGDIAAEIRAQYEEQFPGVTLPELTCEDADVEPGAAINCTGRNSNDLDLTFGGEVTGRDGDRATYRWQITRALIPGRVYEEIVTRTVEERVALDVTSATCPERVELTVGRRVECTITGGDGSTQRLTVELTDVEGGVRIYGEDGAEITG